MQRADEFIHSRGFYLPPFAYWSPDDWASKGEEVSEIVACHLGWDITDFGLGDFKRYGLFLFTVRNGSPENRRQEAAPQLDSVDDIYAYFKQRYAIGKNQLKKILMKKTAGRRAHAN